LDQFGKAEMQTIRAYCPKIYFGFQDVALSEKAPSLEPIPWYNPQYNPVKSQKI
jgi:hypothetical protein